MTTLGIIFSLIAFLSGFLFLAIGVESWKLRLVFIFNLSVGSVGLTLNILKFFGMLS